MKKFLLTAFGICGLATASLAQQQELSSIEITGRDGFKKPTEITITTPPMVQTVLRIPEPGKGCDYNERKINLYSEITVDKETGVYKAGGFMFNTPNKDEIILGLFLKNNEISTFNDIYQRQLKDYTTGEAVEISRRTGEVVKYTYVSTISYLKGCVPRVF